MRFSKYSLLLNTDNGLVIYNSKIAKYVNIFDQKDIEHFNELADMDSLPEDDAMVRQLYINGYVVDDEADEYEEVKKSIYKHYKDISDTQSIMLYVTEACNFRCIYCPQKHLPKNLSEIKWEALYKYLKKQIEAGKLKNIILSFFGGEPLLGLSHILRFLYKMKDLQVLYPNVSVLYTMTTNGYLLTPKVYDEITELGVKGFQITVDGFAETHNQMRKLADGSGTWDVIIKNLKYINTKDDNVRISFRTNCNYVNKSSMEKFNAWAAKTFDNPKFYFDIVPVTKFSDNVSDELLEKTNKEILNNEIQKDGRYAISPKSYLTRLGQTCVCAENYFIISVDGYLYKCEQAYECNDSDSVGYLSDGGDFILNERFIEWTENFETEKCKDCFIYPLCGARMCVRKKALFPNERPDCMASTKDVIKNIAELVENGILDVRHKCKKK